MANEKRLIDANDVVAYLQRTKIDNVLPNWQDLSPTTKCAVLKIVMALRATILRAKTVDAVEVPCRCKECKYWKHYDHLGCTDFVRVCTLAYYMIGENGYCLYGERKDNELP